MPENAQRWIRNLNGAPGPLIMKGLFQAGATQAIKRGEMLELTADTNTRWTPTDSDLALNSNLAIANEEIKAGDRAGYYEIIVPRPGDVFEFDLAVAAATVVGAALYWSSSVAFAASGNNIVGNAFGQEHYPRLQGHLSDDASGDSGETIKTLSVVRMVFEEANSYYSLFQTG